MNTSQSSSGIDAGKLESMLKENSAAFVADAIACVPNLKPHQNLLENDLGIFIEERIRRATELDSEEVKLARKIATRIMSFPTYSISCVDGRVEKAVKLGFPGRLGGDMKVPAANPLEFVQSKNGGLKLLSGSGVALMLEDLFKQFDTVVQILDPHVGCAAQKAACQGRGEDPQDGGLLVGVMHAEEIAEAMRAYVAEHCSGKQVVPLQISFDPHNGWLYMGLETANALSIAKTQGGYTAEVLAKLVTEGTIFFSGSIADEDRFKTMFEQRRSSGDFSGFDLRSNYPGSMLAFWQAIESMTPELLPVLIEKLTILYPDLVKTEAGSAELSERGMILLLSSFMGYLNNLSPEGYPYGIHTEEIVAVSSQKYGPFSRKESFHVAISTPTLVPDVLFAAQIVRDNRKTGRVKGRDPKDPVLVVIKVKVAEEEITQEMWDEVRSRVKWNELMSLEWWQMEEGAFEDWITAFHPTVPGSILRGLKQLFKLMKTLYDPALPSSRELLEGTIVALPVLVDANRRIQCLVPFLLKGY